MILMTKLSQYGFNVVKDGKVIGYIIVSTDKNDSPVPEFGNGSALPFTALENNLQATTIASGKLINKKYVYPSALTYMVEVNAANDQGQESKLLVDLKNGKILENANTNEQSIEAIDVNRNIRAWERLEKKNTSLSQVAPKKYHISNYVFENIISSVPYYSWYRGCAPTSAGMVLAYWAAHGYSNLPTGNTLINELANAMQTDSDGNTYTYMVPYGISTVASNHGYDLYEFNSYNDSYGRAYSTYSEWIGQIDNTRPLLANMQGSSIYGNHTVAGVGYRFDDYQQWIIVHDTWNTVSNIYLDYNSSEVNYPCWTYVIAY